MGIRKSYIDIEGLYRKLKELESSTEGASNWERMVKEFHSDVAAESICCPENWASCFCISDVKNTINTKLF